MVPVSIAVDRGLAVPLHAQVHDQIVAAIAKGDLRPGDKLPTIRELADFLQLNRNTIAQVYRSLEREGYLLTRGSGGSTVSDSAATRSAVRMQTLHQLVRQALRSAHQQGFTAREFSDVAFYEAGQAHAVQHATLLVVDKYKGELDFLCRTVQQMLPDASVRGALMAELKDPAGAQSLLEADYALVPFYCLDEARRLLTASRIPLVAAGVGPSMATLRDLAADVAGKDVTIVCTEAAGARYMERALRHAGVALGKVRRTAIDDKNLRADIGRGDAVVASEGSAESVRRWLGGRPIVVMSVISGDELSISIPQRRA